MTDLISGLADAILACINAQPRTPTKAEIEAVLDPWITTIHTLHVDALEQRKTAEDDAKHGGLSSLWGERVINDPHKYLLPDFFHPEATQAARETYDLKWFDDYVTTKDGRTLNVKVTEGLANALDLAEAVFDGASSCTWGDRGFHFWTEYAGDPNILECDCGARVKRPTANPC
jgi:hypothetical protein